MALGGLLVRSRFHDNYGFRHNCRSAGMGDVVWSIRQNRHQGGSLAKCDKGQQLFSRDYLAGVVSGLPFGTTNVDISLQAVGPSQFAQCTVSAGTK